MPNILTQIPRPLHRPLTALARGAMTPLHLISERAADDLAKRGGRLFAKASFNKGRLLRAQEHIAQAFPELSSAQRESLAVQSYEHLFRLANEFVRTSRMINHDGWAEHLRIGVIEPILSQLLLSRPERPTILITGHCGNWELIGYAVAMLGFPMHAVYRPLDLAPLDEWVRRGRQRCGLTLVSKFGAMRALPPVLAKGGCVGLVADQNGGDRGIFVPFFGRLASTYKSIGLLALQSRAAIVCGTARRGSGESGHYHVELIDAFGPEDWEKHSDPLFYLTARYRRAIETMVRRAPEQYLWMHRIWKSRPPHERANKPFPDALRRKIESLPWMTPAEVQRLVDRSDQDREALAKDPKRSENPPKAQEAEPSEGLDA